MKKRYRVERSVKVTTVDYIEADSEEQAAIAVCNSKSLAGDISALGLAAIHTNVSYSSFGEKLERV
jgi:hypothetical protein